MINKYFSLYFRKLRREKLRILNILSIALSLAFAILILFFVEDELSYDRWNRNQENIYRVTTFEKWPAKEFRSATSTICTGPTLKDEFPEIKSFVRYSKIRDPRVVIDNREFYEDHFYFADSTLLNIFPYELLAGSPADALCDPNSIVLTEEMAAKYFSEKNSLGMTVNVNNEEYTIRGIIRNDINSHLHINAVLSMPHLSEFNEQQAASNNNKITDCQGENVFTYILTNENTDIEQLTSKLPAFYDKVLNLEKGYEYNLVFEPLSATHFSDKKLENDLPTMNIKYIYIFEILLLIILIFSIINYVNLIVGKSVKTSKYIGLSKMYGIKRKEIFVYFISDSVLNVIIASFISLVLLLIILPYYNVSFNKDISLNVLSNKHLPIYFGALWIILGVVPGIILALIFIPIKPILIQKKQLEKRNRSIRKVFVFLEISLLTIVVLGIILVNSQLANLKNKQLGFNKEDIVLIHLASTDLIKNAGVFQNSLEKYPDVLETAVSDISVGDDYWVSTLSVNLNGQMESYDLRSITVDESFCDLYQFELVAGRTFNRESRNDFNNCLINEAALHKLGVGTDALDRQIRIGSRENGLIIGVVKNFYFTSKHNVVEPLFIYLAEEGRYTSTVSVKLASHANRSTIRDLNNEWNSFSPNEDFEYTFVEDKVKAFYSSEERLSVVLKWGTLLSFIIVGFGLICFIIFIVEQRTKEISIRKVNGASSIRIVRSLLLKEFLVPSLAAFIVILPLSQLAVQRFLQAIVTDISISWWIYVVTILVIVLTLLLTTSHQLFKAANRNPLEALNID